MPERRDDFPGAGDHDSTFMMRGLWGHAAATAALLVVSCTFEVIDLPGQTTRRTCGNAIVDPGEVCDDGNTVGGDGCSADCKSLEICGNARLDPGEVCDDGNTVGGDGCSADCTSLEICGNAIVDPGEQCDVGAGGNADNADCTAGCRVNVCGDGRVDALGAHLEQCDGGNGAPRDTATCDSDCTLPVCGDGHVNVLAGEQCDDGALNGTSSSQCSTNCLAR